MRRRRFLALSGAATASPFDAVRERGAVNDVVGDLPVVVHAPDGSLAADVRPVEGTTLVFEAAGVTPGGHGNIYGRPAMSTRPRTAESDDARATVAPFR